MGGSLRYLKKEKNKTTKTSTVFPTISAPDTYLISKHYGTALIRGWHLKEAPYFKVRGIIYMKFREVVVFSYQITTNNFHYNI